MTPGEVRVRGVKGRFCLCFGNVDGTLVCWGPLGSRDAMWRSFRADRVKPASPSLAERCRQLVAL